MKKLLNVKSGITIILFFLSNFVLGQSQQFIYSYQFIPDSTDRKNVMNEIMILDVGKEKSEYFGFDQYSSDSTLLADMKKGQMTMPPNREMISDRVIKRVNSNQILYKTLVAWSKYNVTETIRLDWKLSNEFSKILSYDVQKATTEYGGRKWTAWFTKDLPIPDGPYKFKGLPGLIVKIEDSHKDHIFELKGIKKTKEDFLYPDLQNYKEFDLTYSQFEKFYKNYRKHPTATLVDQIPDQMDANGKLRSSSDILRELNNRWLERLSKDNNIIERNLLN